MNTNDMDGMMDSGGRLGQVADYLRYLTQFFDKFGAWIILPLTGTLIVIDVVLRFVFNDPLIWGLEFARVMLILIFMMAIPECTRRHGHIRMDLLYNHFPEAGKRAVTALYSLTGVAVFLLFAVREFHELIFAFNLGRETEYLSVPLWILNAAKFFSATLLVLFFVLRFVGTIINRDPFPEPQRQTAMWED